MKTPFFFHMPKTGGMSLKKLVVDRWTWDGVYQYYENERPCPFVPDKKSDVVKAFYGHQIYYGMHEVLNRDPDYIVFLREPVKRFVSYYYHNCMVQVKFGREMIPFKPWFDHFRYATMRYYLTRQHPNTVEKAKEILAKCKFIGMQETFAADVTQLFGVTEIPHENVAEDKKKLFNRDYPVIKQEHMDLIRSIMDNDYELYEYALQLRKEGHNAGYTLVGS